MLFGKTMKRLRKRMDLELVINPTRAKKLIAKPTTLHWDIISKNRVSVRKQKPKIIVERSIYLGFCILAFSKITMYKFHYEEILSKYWSRTKLAYTDTDFFIYYIQAPDLCKDMADNLDAYDTSVYSVDHPSTQRRMPRSYARWRTNTRVWHGMNLLVFEPKCTVSSSPIVNLNLLRKVFHVGASWNIKTTSAHSKKSSRLSRPSALFVRRSNK